ncbi:MAG: amidase [Mucilaginibacter sp.]
MHRRNFLKTGSLAGLTLTAVAAATTNLLAEPKNEKDAPSNEAAGKFTLKEVTIAELQQKMESRELTSRAIVEMYLKRIDELDEKGPKLNSVIELNPDSLAIADEMDRERKAGKVRGPMHGIPVLIKDNINTGDKMHTTAGALAIADNIAQQDAFIVKQLRDAGAVLLGKTNLSEWANFRSTRSTSGWSSRGGQTKMPYVIIRNPSGSSAGTGSSISASLATVGIGTETNGSIVSPSSVNGLVGIKPTVGLLSRSGIIPISITQDTAGPMARTVRDAAIFLSVLAGVDPNDSYTLAAKGKIEKDYTTFLDVNGLKGKRLGLEKTHLRGNETVEILFHEAIELLKSKGAEIIEVDLLTPIREVSRGETLVLQYEFKDGLNKYLSKASSKVKSLQDVIDFNKANEAKAMPYFKQETLEQSQKREGLDTKEYLDALKSVNKGSQEIIDKVLKDNKLDAIIGVTNGMACCIDLVNGDYGGGFSFSGPAAMAGYPHITVPMGLVHGLPVGLSFISTAYAEGEIIKLGYAYEQASKKRVAPEFKSEISV